LERLVFSKRCDVPIDHSRARDELLAVFSIDFFMLALFADEQACVADVAEYMRDVASISLAKLWL
jgi:hypothetical protein